MPSRDHVVVNNQVNPGCYTYVCEHCKTHLAIKCPVAVDAFVAAGNAFLAEHKMCPPPPPPKQP